MLFLLFKIQRQPLAVLLGSKKNRIHLAARGIHHEADHTTDWLWCYHGGKVSSSSKIWNWIAWQNLRIAARDKHSLVQFTLCLPVMNRKQDFLKWIYLFILVHLKLFHRFFQLFLPNSAVHTTGTLHMHVLKMMGPHLNEIIKHC